MYAKSFSTGRRLSTPSPFSHAEAMHLARGLHLRIIEAGSQMNLLTSSAAVETELRRLWVILEVERIVACNSATRASAWQALRGFITLTSFGVRNSDTLDRLIFWPRIQNELFVDPSSTDLTDPSMFSRLVLSARIHSVGFALDIANMFHNIVIPAWLVKLLPLSKIAFGNQPGRTQRRIMEKLKLKRKPRQNQLFRPHQRTLPMGFKSAMHIAHSIAATIVDQTFSSLIIRPPKNLNFVRLTKTQRTIFLDPGTVLALQIIDDINFVFLDLPEEIGLSIQQGLWRNLCFARLPRRLASVGRMLYWNETA